MRRDNAKVVSELLYKPLIVGSIINDTKIN